MTPADPKPARRIVDPQAGIEKLMRERVCRICRRPVGEVILGRHHLVPRSLGGDDVDDNLVPLCGSGTFGCHGRVEAGDARARAALRGELLLPELAYCLGKVGAERFNRMYAVRAPN